MDKRMKILFVALLISIVAVLTMPSAIAADWDNWVSYDDKDGVEDKVVTITNWLGLGEELGTAELITPKFNSVFAGNDVRVMEFETKDFSDSCVLNDVEFKNMYSSKYEEKEYHWEKAIFKEVEVEDVDISCTEKLIKSTNGSEDYFDRTCTTTVKGTHIERKIVGWEVLTTNEIPEEDTIIALVTNVRDGDWYDGFPIICGKRVDKWAQWVAGLNADIFAYYKFDTATTFQATSQSNDSVGNYNATYLNITVVDNGLINEAYTFTGEDGWYGYVNASGVPEAIGASANFTISLWYNSSNRGGTRGLFAINTFDGSKGNLTITYLGDGAEGFRFDVETGDSGANSQFVKYWLNGTSSWIHIVAMKNETDMMLYLNGVQVNKTAHAGAIVFDEAGADAFIGAYTSTASADGMIDEVSIWNRTLSNSEISNLYNGGSGISYDPDAPLSNAPEVALVSPEDNIEILSTTQTFNGTCMDDMALSNCSILFDTGIVYNETITGTITNQSIEADISGLPYGTYNWTIRAVDSDNSTTFGTNRTITISAFLDNYFTYNGTVYETENQTFVVGVNVTDSDWDSVTANLIYNGTSYAATKVGTGDYINFTRNMAIPTLTEEGVAENRTFIWELLFESGGTTQGFNTTTNYQYTDRIDFFQCNSSYEVNFINFTFKDEDDDSSVYARIPTSTIYYYLGDGIENRSLSYTNTTHYLNYDFCFYPAHRNVSTNIYMQYGNTSDYPQRVYSPSTYGVTNDTRNQELLLLKSNDGTYVTFQIITGASEPISGASVEGKRTIDGVETTVATGTTGDDGAVTFWLNPDYSHTFTFSKDGYETLETTITPTQALYTITLGETATEEQPDYSRTIKINLYPTQDFLSSDTTYTFNYTISASYWSLEEWGYTLEFSNGTEIDTQSSSVTTGGTLSTSQNTFNTTSILMNYYYVANSTYTNGTRIWHVQHESSYSIWHFFTNLNTHVESDLFGIQGDDGGNFGKALISVLILVMAAGTLSYRYGIVSEQAILGIIFGIVLCLNVLGFIPNPDFMGVVSLGDFLTYLTLVIAISMIIKEEYT